MTLGILLSALLMILTGPDYRFGGFSMAMKGEVPGLPCSAMDDPEALNAEISVFVSKGSPILFFPLWILKRSLAASEPSLSRIELRLSYVGAPVLEVGLVPRVPEVRLKDGNRELLLDENGIVFGGRPVPCAVHASGKVSAHNLDWIELKENVCLLPGERLAPPLRERIALAIRALDKVRELRFTSLVLDGSGAWSLCSRDGLPVRLGSPDSMEGKLSVLPPILEMARRRKLSLAYIDLRRLRTPILKLLARRKALSKALPNTTI